MKLFLKTFGVFLFLFLMLLAGLKLYFTDARLKSLVLPPLREATQTEIQIDYLTVTWLRTFPHFGLRMNGFVLPDQSGDTVLDAQHLTASIGLWPLLQDKIYLHSLSLDQLKVSYHLDKDGASNIDFLLPDTTTDTSESTSTYAVAIPKFNLSNASVTYWDESTGQKLRLNSIEGRIALSMDQKISTDLDINFGDVSIIDNEQVLVNQIPIAIKQTLVLDPTNEQLEIREGEIRVKGLRLSISGLIQQYSSENPHLDLSISSNSDDFGELLSLIPAPYDQRIQGWSTRGSITVNGNVSGILSEAVWPQFEIQMSVANGYLKNPEFPQAIENVALQININNDLLEIPTFEATAESSYVSGKAEIKNWLDKDPHFISDLDAELDLSIIPQFYDVSNYEIEQIRGQLRAFANIRGQMEDLAQTVIDGSFILRDGSMKFVGVAQSVDKVEANIRTSANRIFVDRIEVATGKNRVQLSGTIMDPLHLEHRRLALQSDFEFDLATLDQYYPVSPDTLQTAGVLTGHLNLDGALNLERPDKMISGGSIEWKEGQLYWYEWPQRLEPIQVQMDFGRGMLTAKEIQVTSGLSKLSFTGEFMEYLGENPLVNGQFTGVLEIGEWQDFNPVQAYAEQINGQTEWDVTIKGPIYQPDQLQLTGSGRLTDVGLKSEALSLPIRHLNGQIQMTPQEIALENIQMEMGSSDYAVKGTLTDYMNLLVTDQSPKIKLPLIRGNYHSQKIDMDELIDWDAESSDEPIAVSLPGLQVKVMTQIDTLVIMGSHVYQIGGDVMMEPDSITIEDATAQWFEGTLNGNLSWTIPKPDRTELHFRGAIREVSASAFLSETGFLGKSGNLHQYISGQFSTDVNYWTVLDPTLLPAIGTTMAEGHFGMTKTRLKNHPIQLRLAEVLNVKELKNMALDEWKASYTITDTVLTLTNMQLSSGQIGMRLDGTQHLISNHIDYYATLLLPSQFKGGIARVLSEQAASALQREDGIIEIALHIRGTLEDPKVSPDEVFVKKAVEVYMKRMGRKLLDKLNIQGK